MDLLKDYLGDSVYVKQDECGGFLLYLDNGYGPHTEIYLEPEVYEALTIFVERAKRNYQEQLDQGATDDQP